MSDQDVLLRELKTASSFFEMTDKAKELASKFVSHIVDKFRSFSPNKGENVTTILTPEEKEIVNHLPPEYTDQITQHVNPYQLNEALYNVYYDPDYVTIPKQEEVQKKPRKRRTPKEKEQLIEEAPEVATLNVFNPDIVEDNIFFDERDGKHIDASYNVFIYLKAFGCTTGTWYVGPEHLKGIDNVNTTSRKKLKQKCSPLIDGVPICTSLAANEYNIDDLVAMALGNSKKDIYFPPKGIIGNSHPGCTCRVEVYLPDSPQNIPDSAPGLPTYGSPEEMLVYKERIFKKLKKIAVKGFVIPVDRWTTLSKDIYADTYTRGQMIDEYEGDIYHKDTLPELLTEDDLDDELEEKYHGAYSYSEINKFAKKDEQWFDDIKPVIVSNGFVFKNRFGVLRPVPTTYMGFQLARNEKSSLIQLSYMNFPFKVDSVNVKEVKLRKVPSSQADCNMFVKVDDTFGIIIQVYSSNKMLCFLPEFGNTVFVDSGDIYEII